MKVTRSLTKAVGIPSSGQTVFPLSGPVLAAFVRMAVRAIRLSYMVISPTAGASVNLRADLVSFPQTSVSPSHSLQTRQAVIIGMDFTGVEGASTIRNSVAGPKLST